MKVNSKQLLITLISVIIVSLISFTFLTRGTMTPGSDGGGYIVVTDQKVSTNDFDSLGVKTMSGSIYLRNENCEGIVNYCSYTYKTGVDSRADINHDGKIDISDIKFSGEGFGCDSGDSICWDKIIEECYFTINNRKFKDPNEDCYMGDDDLTLIKNYRTSSPTVSTSCYSGTQCLSDLNRDGKIDMKDIAVVAKKLGTYADTFIREGYQRDADINGDGKIDMMDISLVAKNFNENAIERRCTTSSLQHVSENIYYYTVSGVGLDYVGISYRCTL